MAAAALLLAPTSALNLANVAPIFNGVSTYQGFVLYVANPNDSAALQAGGWIPVLVSSLIGSPIGPTAARPAPTNVPAGTLYLDSTLGVTVASDGRFWRNIATGLIG